MNKLYIQDRQTYKITHREFTDEGFLKVPGRVAKTGTQNYLRRELGLDGNPNDIVTVYRPEDEVFNDDSLSSFDGADITVMHPSELVNAKNFKSTSVGVVRGSGRRDGDFVVADLMIKDAAAIKTIESGTVELSAGYLAEYVADEGTAPNGEKYQFVQRGIKINHVAIVPSARAGKQARIFDNNPKGKTMHKVVLDSGRSIEVQDEATALLVTDTIERLKESVDAAKKTADEAKADADRKQAKIDAMEEEAEKKKGETSDSIISDRIAKITDAKDRAKDIDSTYTADSIDPVAIMRGVLTSVRPTVDWTGKSDEYVSAAFDFAHEQSKSGGSVKSADQKRQLAADAAANVTQITDGKAKTARDSYIERMTNQKGA